MIKNSLIELKDRFLGGVFGFAIGDGMGYAKEYTQELDIEELYDGITKPYINPYTGNMLISDDTQLMLFTIDGLVWSYIRCTSRGVGSYESSGVWQSYGRWYYTQTGYLLDEYLIHKHEHEPVALSTIGVNTILDYEELYSNRNPSEELIYTIEGAIMGSCEAPINECKDPSGLTRVMPVGLFLHDDPREAFEVAARLSAITHGHPNAYLSAGVFAHIIAVVCNGKELNEAVRSSLMQLKEYEYFDEVNESLDYVLHISECNYSIEESLELLEQAYDSAQVLAMGVFCALKCDTYAQAVQAAANISGNSSAVASVAGAIAGVIQGRSHIPESFVDSIELKRMMEIWTDKLYKLREF